MQPSQASIKSAVPKSFVNSQKITLNNKLINNNNNNNNNN